LLLLFLSLYNKACVSDCEQQNGIQDGETGISEQAICITQ